MKSRRSAADVNTDATAIESSSGIAPSRGVSRTKLLARSLSPSTFRNTAITSRVVSKQPLVNIVSSMRHCSARASLLTVSLDRFNAARHPCRRYTVTQQRIHMNTILLHQLVLASADRSPASTALKSGGTTVDYQTLSTSIERFAGAMVALGLSANDRVAVFLEKRAEMVIACFGAACGGAVFVPINPVLKREQVAHILSDC